MATNGGILDADFPFQRYLIALPWEPTTFIFRGYNPYIGGLKPSFFVVLGSKGSNLLRGQLARSYSIFD